MRSHKQNKELIEQRRKRLESLLARDSASRVVMVFPDRRVVRLVGRRDIGQELFNGGIPIGVLRIFKTPNEYTAVTRCFVTNPELRTEAERILADAVNHMRRI